MGSEILSFVCLAVVLVAAGAIGTILAIVALTKVNNLQRELAALRHQLNLQPPRAAAPSSAPRA